MKNKIYTVVATTSENLTFRHDGEKWSTEYPGDETTFESKEEAEEFIEREDGGWAYQVSFGIECFDLDEESTWFIARKRQFLDRPAEYCLLTAPDGEREPREFDGKAHALAELAKLQQMTYVQDYDEAGHPEYLLLHESYLDDWEKEFEAECLERCEWDHCADPESPTEAEEIVAVQNANAKAWEKLLLAHGES